MRQHSQRRRRALLSPCPTLPLAFASLWAIVHFNTHWHIRLLLGDPRERGVGARLGPWPAPADPFRPVVVSVRGPEQSPILPFVCCVGSLPSDGGCGLCSCWCCCPGAQGLVYRGVLVAAGAVCALAVPSNCQTTPHPPTPEGVPEGENEVYLGCRKFEADFWYTSVSWHLTPPPPYPPPGFGPPPH